MKTLKVGDIIEYDDLKQYGLYYLCNFAHFYLLTTGQHLVFYDPLNQEVYSIIKYPTYETQKR